MKTLACILVILYRSIIGIAQSTDELDSLTNLLQHTDRQNLREISDINARLGWLFYNIQRYDSALSFYRKALDFPAGESEPRWRGNVHFGTGATYHSINLWDSAFHHYQKALIIFTNLNDDENIATTNANLSLLYRNKGLYEEALSSALRALITFEKGSASLALASCYNNIGGILLRINNYTDALTYHHKALAVRLKINQPLEVAKSYNNLGELYILTHQYDSAKSYLLHAADIKQQLNDIQGLARTHSRLGKVLILTGETFAAEKQLRETLQTQIRIPDSVGMIESLNNLGELYLITNKLPQSAKLLDQANILIRHSGTPEYLRQNLELRVRLAREQKDFASGMHHLEDLLIVRDSLLNEEKTKSLQAMQIRYETQKKEQEIVLLEQREEVNKARIRNNQILIGALATGLVLIASIGVLIYINLKNTRAAKQRFELLLSETRHRIKNNLQTLASIFHLQTRHYTDHEMVLEARSSESRVHTMSMLHERFYSNDSDQTIETREYITDLAHKLIDIYGTPIHNLKLSLNIDDVALDVDKALALSLIIQELVCNAFKYAFDHQPDPELSIHLQLNGDCVVTTIHDNGIGLNTLSAGTSHGLGLVDALVSQLNGKMQIDNHGGTTFVIQFPVTSLWRKHAFS